MGGTRSAGSAGAGVGGTRPAGSGTSVAFPASGPLGETIARELVGAYSRPYVSYKTDIDAPLTGLSPRRNEGDKVSLFFDIQHVTGEIDRIHFPANERVPAAAKRAMDTRIVEILQRDLASRPDGFVYKVDGSLDLGPTGLSNLGFSGGRVKYARVQGGRLVPSTQAEYTKFFKETRGGPDFRGGQSRNR